MHKLVDGCSTAGKDVANLGEFDTISAGNVVCCSVDGSSATRKDDDGTCLTTRKTPKKTYWEASEMCAALGRRLCASQAEVDLACVAGCGHDGQPVWTSIKVEPLKCSDLPDVPTPKWKQKGRACSDFSKKYMKKLCNSKKNKWRKVWIKNKYCQKSCMVAKRGYADDRCVSESRRLREDNIDEIDEFDESEDVADEVEEVDESRALRTPPRLLAQPAGLILV
jgi:hypothetical protein